MLSEIYPWHAAGLRRGRIERDSLDWIMHKHGIELLSLLTIYFRARMQVATKQGNGD
jgi:hypothetical protein